MPIKIPNGLPAAQTLAGENIFVMDETRAVTQDIRPLRIAISGKASTPGGAVEIAYLLGKDETIRRVKAAIEKLG